MLLLDALNSMLEYKAPVNDCANTAHTVYKFRLVLKLFIFHSAINKLMNKLINTVYTPWIYGIINDIQYLSDNLIIY